MVKKIFSLKEKSRDRRKSGLFVLEGVREFNLAIKGKYHIETIFFHGPLMPIEKVRTLIQDLETPPNVIEVSKEVYQKLAHRETTEGMLALAKSKSHNLMEFPLNGKHPLILVAEAPEKPGNIGALLRTADAANLDGVLIANPKGDLYNPNIVRSSIGCIFTVNIATGTSEEIIHFLKENEIAIYCAALSSSKIYTSIDFRGASAIVVGTEATGLSEEWLKNASDNILIPMEGEIDSMNVSVSAAILIFEAKRQRAF